MIEPIFIEARRLGSVVEAKTRQIIHMTDKRKRASEAKKLLNLLRYLNLAPYPTQQLDESGTPDTSPPSGIAIGIRSDGELGLWLIYQSPIKVQGDIA